MHVEIKKNLCSFAANNFFAIFSQVEFQFEK